MQLYQISYTDNRSTSGVATVEADTMPDAVMALVDQAECTGVYRVIDDIKQVWKG